MIFIKKMIAKEKVIETIKSFYTKFRKLSKSKQIAVVLGAILILLILSKRDDHKSQDSALSNSLTSINSSGRNQITADLNLALSNKVLKTTLQNRRSYYYKNECL